MADALCGPSNALQNFKQHTQVDRSLQQDRLAGPRTSAQAFRTHDPRTGSLDADFHAFENAAADPFQEPLVGNGFVPHAPFPQMAPSNWASDFQQLSISEQPLSAQQFRSHAPMVKSTNANWHNEFMRQQYGGQSSVAQGKQVAFNQQNMSTYTPQMQYQSSFAPTSSFGPQMNLQQALPIQAANETASVDWSQAFEEAFQDAFTEVEQVQQAEETQETSTVPENATQEPEMVSDIRQPDQVRIGADAINYTEMKDRTVDHEKQEASSLARVAGELLHNVQHDSSEKFQNSQFLDLMRKIRDRQVEVRNNDFETTENSTTPSLMQHTQQATSINDHDVRSAPDPVQNQDTFSFPDMNAVHAPREADFVDYSFDSDQFPSQPQNQFSDLHPGGKYYPEQSGSAAFAQMSGAVPASEFEARYDENRTLASKFGAAA